MSSSDDDDLDVRLGALRAEPPDTGFLGRLRGALEAEASGAAPSTDADVQPDSASVDVVADLDLRLAALKEDPPDTGFDVRLRSALEREAARRGTAFPYLQSWFVRAAIVLLAIFAPVAVYAAGVRIVQAIRAVTSPASEAPAPRPVAPVDRAPSHAPRMQRIRPDVPRLEAVPTISAPAPIERLAPSRERFHAPPPADVTGRPDAPPVAEQPAAVEAPALAPTAPPAPIERLRIDPRAPHREGELRPPPREVGERPPVAGTHDGRGAPGEPRPPSATDGRRPPPGGTTPLPRDTTRPMPPPDRLPPRDRSLPPPGERPMPPLDRPPPMERPMRLP